MAYRHHLRQHDAIQEKAPKVFVHRDAPAYKVFVLKTGSQATFSIDAPTGRVEYTRVVYLSRHQYAEMIKREGGLNRIAGQGEVVTHWMYAPMSPGVQNKSQQRLTLS